MSRSIRIVLLSLIGLVIIIVQSALIGVVANLSYKDTMQARTGEMGLMVETVAKSLGDFGEQLSMLVNGMSKAYKIQHFLETGDGLEGAEFFIAAMSQSSPAINSLYIFDATGQMRAIQVQGKATQLSDLTGR